ncbi:MAG TPA: lipid-binding SYLF domain-containing protein [Povalibacter sp.]|uniref:lipid-binding SYLF domain-containing protein n=1 Tax=Povalibacter sp. TaxID=1962978 RepID=UPI002B59E695|nr:lipid-binding SYLF domain-containing protein [Povalibacter sp.]HMN46091.1 lipid-binding SYLF domain-containing protein [Povalibacter sp.]
MKSILSTVMLSLTMLFAVAAHADEYVDTINVFKKAGKSAEFFNKSYGYAVFPTVGKGGLVVGAAHGTGRVYQHGKYVGDTSITQLSIGFQAGGEAFSEIIFFENKAAFDKFTAGNFELAATVHATAITASASASASTAGSGAGASGTKHNAATAGGYQEGLAVFTVAKGGLMYEATVAGQKFSYKPNR